MGKKLSLLAGWLAAIATLSGCTTSPLTSISPLSSILYGQSSSDSKVPPPNGGYYVDPTSHLVTEAPAPPYYIDDDGIIQNTPPNQVAPAGAQPCESDVLSELQPGTACYAAALREEQLSNDDNEREEASEKAWASQSKGNSAQNASLATETCGVADGYSLKDAIEQAMASPGGGPEPQVVQLINWQMAQTTLGWACIVEVDFLGGSYQVLAYKRLPNGHYRMQTQVMGQAPLDSLP